MTKNPGPRRQIAAALASLTIAAATAVVVSTPAIASEIISDTTVTGQEGTAFGATTSQVSCDVNGDGSPDLAVGTYATFDMTPGATGAYVLLGAGTGATAGTVESNNPIRLIDTSRNYMGGVDVRCAGDANGDGYDDLIVIAQASAAFVVFGSADFSEVELDALGERGRLITGSVTRGNGIGDIDDDGIDEIAVTDTSGAVTILHADSLTPESTLASLPGPRISGPGVDLVSVTRAGDMNGDGREDLAVGAASWQPAGSNSYTGAIWIITDATGDVEVGDAPVPGFRIDGPPRGYDLLGTSTVGLGDINGDGYDDLLIGGESDDPLPGSAVVVTGGPDGVNVETDPLIAEGFAVHVADGATATQRGWWFNGIASGDHFGHAVGAVRMDGWSMLLVGGMDGSPDPARTNSGYAVAVDSRELTNGGLPTSSTGVFEAADLLSAEVAGADLIIGDLPGQRLGRAFADLTADQAGTSVTFAIGAPALFGQELPSVRIITLQVPEPAAPEPEPGTEEPEEEDTSDQEKPGSTQTQPRTSEGPTSNDDAAQNGETEQLSTTGASSARGFLGAAIALLGAGAGVLIARRNVSAEGR